MISAVVATYGRLDVLRRTLPTVLEQDLPADEYEVVVVVDGPDAATCDWLRGLSSGVRLSIVQQQHLGLAAARNTGLRKASGETVVLLDNDLLCEPQLLRAHAAAHGEVPLVAFGPVLVSSESPRTIASEWVKRAPARRGRSSFRPLDQTGHETSPYVPTIPRHDSYCCRAADSTRPSSAHARNSISASGLEGPGSSSGTCQRPVISTAGTARRERPNAASARDADLRRSRATCIRQSSAPKSSPIGATRNYPPCILRRSEPIQLKDSYASSRVFAQPSVFENFSFAALEAMAAGRAAVVTSGSGLATFIADCGADAVVAPHDPAALAAALKPF
jgi:glycosyltransferase involved in cell wall biosynthesis